MQKTILIISVALFILLGPLSSFAATCQISTPESRSDKKLPTLLIRPFEVSKKDPLASKGLELLVSVLLKDYLSSISSAISSKDNPPLQSAEKAQAGFIMTGKLIPAGGRHHMTLSLFSTEKQGEVAHAEGEIELPFQINQALLDAIPQISAALGPEIKPKKLIPYLNISNKLDAYLLYARGIMALQSPTKESLEEAIRIFGNAIEQDYNYVPAYLGLAEALAARSAWEKMTSPEKIDKETPWEKKAKIELEKAKLLNPVLTKAKKGRVEWYLEYKNSSCS